MISVAVHRSFGRRNVQLLGRRSDVLGFTAVASDVSDPRVVRSLLDNKANSAIKSKDGETALDWALKFGNPEILRLLGSSPLKRKLAVKPTAYSNGDAAAVVGRAMPLLQKSANEFFKQSGCVGCHHQNLSGFAVAAASRKGVSVDEKPIAEQRLIAKSELLRERENVLQGFIISPEVCRLQRVDGGWPQLSDLPSGHRTPMVPRRGPFSGAIV